MIQTQQPNFRWATPLGLMAYVSVPHSHLTRSWPTATPVVTTQPFPGLPPTGMVTANLAHISVEHVATHMHALVFGGRLMTFNPYSQI